MIKAGVLNAGVPMNRDSMFQAGITHLLSDGVMRGVGDECTVETNVVKTGAVLLKVTRTTVSPVESFLIPVEITTNETIDTSGNGYIILRADAGKINDGATITTLDGSGIVTLEKVSVLPANNYLLLATLAGGVITNNKKAARIRNAANSANGFHGEDTGTVNAIQVNIPDLPDITDGITISVKIANNNTGDSTISVNGMSAVPIRKNFNIPLEADDLKVGMIAFFLMNISSNTYQLISTASISSVVSVSPTDTTTGFLLNKLSIGTNLSGTVLNSGANEVMQINNPYDGSQANVQTFNTTGFHAWVKPTGAKLIHVKLWGGGGGGGGGTTRGGGGGGAYNEITVPATSFPSTVNLFVGSGGVGAQSENLPGGAGQSSYIDTITQAGGGGGGGRYSGGSVNAAYYAGGGGGTEGNGGNGNVVYPPTMETAGYPHTYQYKSWLSPKKCFPFGGCGSGVIAVDGGIVISEDTAEYGGGAGGDGINGGFKSKYGGGGGASCTNTSTLTAYKGGAAYLTPGGDVGQNGSQGMFGGSGGGAGNPTGQFPIQHGGNGGARGGGGGCANNHGAGYPMIAGHGGRGEIIIITYF